MIISKLIAPRSTFVFAVKKKIHHSILGLYHIHVDNSVENHFYQSVVMSVFCCAILGLVPHAPKQSNQNATVEELDHF